MCDFIIKTDLRKKVMKIDEGLYKIHWHDSLIVIRNFMFHKNESLVC